jgi:hypothetical protein
MSGNVTGRRALFALALAGGAPVAFAAPQAKAAEAARRATLEARITAVWATLTPPERAAWARMAERIVAGMPTREAGYRMYRELGIPAREARDRTDAALASVAHTSSTVA